VADRPRGARIVLEKVGLSRGAARILDAIDLTVESGELLVLVGPSGSGKSTLLKTINRLLVPTTGRVSIDDRDTADIPLQELRRSVGYCFQALGLFPHFTVSENVGIGLRLAGSAEDVVGPRVDELLERVGLRPDEVKSRLPATLSGGQAQRVAFARALATRPPVLLLDEPFGALDPETRAQIQEELLSVCAEDGVTTLLVSHDIGEALTLARRVAVLHGGRLLRVAEPAALVRDPGDPRIEALLAPARKAARAILDLSSPAQPEAERAP
jgi:osmoprotectant transport system ATP-binding protein